MRIPSLILFLSFVLAPLANAQTKRITGFSETSGKAQTEAEEKFDSYLNPSNLDLWMKRLAARPHHLGSAVR